jgi:DNA replication and repair protein RecF
MQITHITLNNFRKFDNFSIKFEPITLITGVNGAGKTSILEAIYTLSLGHSFHTRKINPILKIGQEKFTIFAKLTNGEDNNLDNNLEHKIGLSKSKDNITYRKIDQEKITSQTPILNKMPVLAITPQKFSLLRQPASNRRTLLDWGVYYKNPEFIKALKAAKKVISQRNTLLKAKAPINQITAWDKTLISLTNKINTMRLGYFEDLISELEPKIKATFPDLPIKISYYPGWRKDASFEDILNNNLNMDLKSGFTHAGVQRADIKITIERQNANEILSQGQQKTLVSLMFLSQATLFQKYQNKPCILLLDDLNSELDPNHLRQLLVELLKQKHQLILTAISKDMPIVKLLNELVKQPLGEFCLDEKVVV